MPVEVAPYNPEWKRWFEELRQPIFEKVRDYVIDVVHVGSTSIEGMSAKPIIDIDVLVDNWDGFPMIVELLAELGYEHQGDLGIKEREAFRLTHQPIYPHYLYVCHKDSLAYKNHVLLKKHLAENPGDFKRYEELKINLGKTVSDTDEYTRLKTELILEFLSAESLSEEELNTIRLQNLP